MEHITPFAKDVYQTYGLLGLIVVAVLICCGWFFHKTLVHFMGSIDKKDAAINDLVMEFTKQIEGNTSALAQNSEPLQRLVRASEKMTDHVENMSSQNKLEHAEILQFVRRPATR